MFSVSALLLDDELKPATPLTNGAINQTLRQWRLPASAGWLSWIVDVDKPSVERLPRQHNRPDLSPSCLWVTGQAWSTLITQLVSVVVDLSAMSDISQGSVATYMRCGRIFSDSVTTNFFLNLDSKRTLKIGNYLMKLLTYNNCAIFWGSP